MKEISVKSILRFLFPEIQIIDAIKEDGFIAKKQKRQRRRDAGQTMTAGNTQYQSYGGTDTGGAAPSGGSGGRQKSAARAANMDANKAEREFEGVELLLRRSWVASETAVNSLCAAFKRPYVMGTERDLPRNTILLIGKESHGKVKAIQDLCMILKQKRILRSGEVQKLDMRDYPTATEEMLFITDLYKALYTQGEAVVFENIEKANPQRIRILQQLISTGCFKLSKRYAWQNNILVDATSALHTASVSELNANGKYFVFTSVLPAEKVTELLGNAFARMIGDIVELDELEYAQLWELAQGILRELQEKADKHLLIDLRADDSCADRLVAAYDPAAGIGGMKKYAEENLYKPMAEYRLRAPAQKREAGYLEYRDGFQLRLSDAVIDLAGFAKNYDALALDKVKQELNQVIGLAAVKEYVLNLENNLAVQKLRSAKGMKTADLSMHMIFTGNPGTGKTTIARIVAKYLKAIGVLSSGQLREVSRGNLVGQYVGQTARLTTELVNSAIGGVLFIDEAYSLCRDKNDTFGLEAVDALVKGIEDNRDNLVVILAGYSDEMKTFLGANPGLRSRFPNVIHFEDYIPEEMYEIAEITARSKGYRLAKDCRTPMLELFERKQVKGRNDSGNGRLARNVIEAAILKQAQRIARDHRQDLELLTRADFGLDSKKPFRLEEELSKIVGLESVKDFVRTQYNLILAREKRKKANLRVDTTQTLNMVFSGNPGTGKTTMARVVADMFHEMGLLKTGHLVETDKGGLIAEYAGQTAKKTEAVFRSALGGVLFIDEAYAITNDGSSYGQECVDTIVKLIEDYRGEILVILAGYTKEMKDFMKSNSGLESRFPLQIEFPDYSAEELFEIGKAMVEARGFRFSGKALPAFRDAVYHLRQHASAASGNGRMIRNYVDKIIGNQSNRIALNDVSAGELAMIQAEDIQPETAKREYDLEHELGKVIGLEAVKNYIRSLNARLLVQEQRKKLGMKSGGVQTLHMIFMGNPGTGKTMMARTVANVLYSMGIIATNKLVETDRSGLVAGYVGQTAIKTRKVIESALDGVLFVDEAYSLAQGGPNDFGQEAIDTLVKMMDDNRDRLVVILAGYNEDMKNFLGQNMGLQSRFPNIISFEDYSTDELVQIGEKMYKEQGYVLSQEAAEKLRLVFREARKEKQFGNGRYVRNVFEKSLNAQAVRLSRSGKLSEKNLAVITAEDIEEVFAR